MLDIQFIRENKDLLRFSLERRGVVADLDALVHVDDERKKAGDNKALLEELLATWRALMLTVPNLLDISVPAGKKDEYMFELRTGAVTEAQPTRSLAEMHAKYGVVSSLKNNEVTTRRYTGESASIYEVLRNYVLRELRFENSMYNHAQLGVSKDALIAGQIFDADADKNMYLAPLGYIPEYAHIYGLETQVGKSYEQPQLPAFVISEGAIVNRNHASPALSSAVSILALSEPSHQVSVTIHETITAKVELLLTTLGLPHTVSVRTALYTPVYAVKSYHLALMVGEEKVPLTDTAYMHDFLSRRLGVKMKNQDGKTRFVHMACMTGISLDVLFDAFVCAHDDAPLRAQALTQQHPSV